MADKEEVSISVEETNRLRLSLGLRPLAAPRKAKIKKEELNHNASETVKQSLAKAKEMRERTVMLTHGPTLGDDVADAELVKAFGGKPDQSRRHRHSQTTTLPVMPNVQDEGTFVMEDVSVLDDSMDTDKMVSLNGDVSTSKKRTPAGNNTAPSSFVQGPKYSEEEFSTVMLGTNTTAPAGSRLFVSDATVSAVAATDVAIRKDNKKKKQKLIEFPKIIRRNHGDKAISTRRVGGDDDDDELVGNPPSTTIVDVDEQHDDDAEFVESLNRARTTNVQKLLSNVGTNVGDAEAAMVAQSVQHAAQHIPYQGQESAEIVINDFAGIRPAAATRPQVPVVAPVVAEALSSSSSLPPISTTDVSIEPPQLQQPAPKPKKKSSLAATLSMLKEQGALQSDRYASEIIVGRANDPKPDAQLNKAGDSIVYEHRDKEGRLQTVKEAWRELTYQLRGQQPGAKSKAKRQARIQREELLRAAKDGETPLGLMSATSALLSKTKQAAFVLPKT